jgi:hypothetical protein
MLSSLAGNTLGISKYVSPILVRMPRRGVAGQFKPEDWIEGVAKVDDDLGTPNSETTAIVLMVSRICIESPF